MFSCNLQQNVNLEEPIFYCYAVPLDDFWLINFWFCFLLQVLSFSNDDLVYFRGLKLTRTSSKLFIMDELDERELVFAWEDKDTIIDQLNRFTFWLLTNICIVHYIMPWFLGQRTNLVQPITSTRFSAVSLHLVYVWSPFTCITTWMHVPFCVNKWSRSLIKFEAPLFWFTGWLIALFLLLECHGIGYCIQKVASDVHSLDNFFMNYLCFQKAFEQQCYHKSSCLNCVLG